jgi:hypothetical protein
VLIIADVFGVAQSQLAAVSTTPASNITGLQQDTGVFTSTGDLDDGLAELERGHARGELVISDIIRISRAERTPLSPAPTSKRGLVDQGTGVIGAHRKQIALDDNRGHIDAPAFDAALCSIIETGVIAAPAIFDRIERFLTPRVESSVAIAIA